MDIPARMFRSVNQARLLSSVDPAALRAALFLRSCQFPSGAINDPLPNPLASLGHKQLSRRARFQLQGGADVWHTLHALRAFSCVGQADRKAERFVEMAMNARGELSYWSLHPGLCIETCALAALVLPRLREKLIKTIRRHALPEGRWPTFLLPRGNGYDVYSTGPSVTAWALFAISSRWPEAKQGRDYLQLAQEVNGTWASHPGFYATPLYPAHLAIAFVQRKNKLLSHVLSLQQPTGGWGYGVRSDGLPSALPTAFALSTLVATKVRSRIVLRAMTQAMQFLLDIQRADGRFPLAPAPAALFYTGDVYTTSVAVHSLVSASKVLR